MPVKSHKPSVLRTQEFFNRIASVTNEGKDRLSVFDFSYRLDQLNLWDSIKCYWPMLKNQNAGLSDTIYGVTDYFDAKSQDDIELVWQNQGVYLEGNDFMCLEQNESLALQLQENDEYLTAKQPYNIGNFGTYYDPKEDSFMLVVKPDTTTLNYSGTFNLRNTDTFQIAIDRVFEAGEQSCILEGITLENTNPIATNCYFSTYKFWSFEPNCLGRYCLDWKWVSRQGSAPILTTWSNVSTGQSFEKRWNDPNENNLCSNYLGTVGSLVNAQLSSNINSSEFASIIYTNQGGVNGNKRIQINDTLFQTNAYIESSLTDFYGISLNSANNRWYGNVSFYIQFSDPQANGTLALYTAFKETLGKGLDLP